MSLLALVMPSRDAAIALVRALGDDPRHQRDGVPLPRCEHPRWWLRGGPLARLRRAVASGRRGLVAACPCTARDQPSVRCPHVTWQAASVLELPDGTALVQAEADAVAHRAEPRRALTDDERETLDEPWTLRGERRDQGHD